MRTTCAVPPSAPTAATTIWLLIDGSVTWVENVPALTAICCLTPLTDRYTDVAVVVPLTVIVRLVAVERSAGLVTASCGAAGGA